MLIDKHRTVVHLPSVKFNYKIIITTIKVYNLPVGVIYVKKRKHCLGFDIIVFSSYFPSINILTFH